MRTLPALSLVVILLVGCGASTVRVSTPLQGEIVIVSERDAQKASRAVLNRIDANQAATEKIDEQLKKAGGPTKQAERLELEKQKQALAENSRKNLQEFLAFVPKVESQGWKLQPFDEARYYYYSNRFKDLLPKTTSAT